MDSEPLIKLPFASLSNYLTYTDQKALKYSFCNCVAFICLLSVCLIFTAIFLVLQVFLRPLVWALLVGTCLFPCQSILTKNLHDYFQNQKLRGCPFCVSLLIAPMMLIHASFWKLFQFVSEEMISFFSIMILTGLFTFMQEFGLFLSIGICIIKTYILVSGLFSWISYIFSVYLVVILFVVHFAVTSTGCIEISHATVFWLPYLLWSLLLLAVTSFIGIFQPVVVLCIFTFVLWTSLIDSRAPDGLLKSPDCVSSDSLETQTSCSKAGQLLRRLSFAPKCKSADRNTPDANSESSEFLHYCFIWLGFAHFSVAFWTRVWVAQLAVLVFLIGLVVYLCARLRVPERTQALLALAHEYIISWLRNRTASDDHDEAMPSTNLSEQLLPLPLRTSLKRAVLLEGNLYDFSETYLDYLVSFVIIGVMLLTTLLLTLFIAFQVHGETLHVISLSSNLLNMTVHSGVFSWLPDQTQVNSLLRSAIGDVHQVGRSFIISKVDELFQDSSVKKAAFQNQILEIWEKICDNFFQESITNESFPKLLLKSKFLDSEGIFDNFTGGRTFQLKGFWKNLKGLLKSTTLFEWGALVNTFRDNLDFIINVLNSIWRIIVGQAGFLTSCLLSTVSLLFAGGSVLLNFTVSFLIFITTLFYLLSVSGSTYLPVEFIVSLTPQPTEASPSVLSFYTAVESAIASVLVTTLKRTVFYGLYTVLTYSLFGLDIVVLPSIFATVLGAVPVVGSYWAAFPGIVELLGIRGSLWPAFLLFLLHLLPHYFLDTALYSEIKGAGHPYLTGLSIAGGLYYFGIEGTFIGPILLCCLLVGFNLYRCFLYENDSCSVVGKSQSAYFSLAKPRRLTPFAFTNLKAANKTLFRKSRLRKSISLEYLCPKTPSRFD